MISAPGTVILLVIILAAVFPAEAQESQRKPKIPLGQLTQMTRSLPDFRNAPFDEAAKHVYVRVFQVNLARETDFNSSVATGTVTKQDPDPGTPMRLGMTVRLWVAETPPVQYFRMENFVGQQIDEVRKHPYILKLQLRIETEENPTTDFTTGIVTDQEPKPGFRIEIGSMVKFRVAREVVIVPPVEKLPFDQAQEIIINTRLTVARETRLTNDQPPGTVVNQFPEPGTRVDPQTEVRLIVAEPINVGTPEFSEPATPAPETPVPPPSLPPPAVDIIPWAIVVVLGGAAMIFILRLFRRKPDGKKDEPRKQPVTDAIQYRVSSDPGSLETELVMETPSLFNLEVQFLSIQDSGEQVLNASGVLVKNERISYE